MPSEAGVVKQHRRRCVKYGPLWRQHCLRLSYIRQQLGVGRGRLVHVQLLFGAQVMLAEHIEIRVQCRGRIAVPRQFEAQRRNFGGAQVIYRLPEGHYVAATESRKDGQALVS